VPVLTSLGGTLRIDPRLPALSLPALTSVGGDVQFDDTGLTRIERLELPQLITVGGAFTVKNTTKLATLAVPALTSVGGAFSLQFSALSSLSLPALRATTGLTLAFNESLTALDVQGPLAVGARDGVDVVMENNVSLPCDVAGAVVCALAPAPAAAEVSLIGNAGFFCVAPAECVQ
jgi:hypothetical protein